MATAIHYQQMPFVWFLRTQGNYYNRMTFFSGNAINPTTIIAPLHSAQPTVIVTEPSSSAPHAESQLSAAGQQLFGQHVPSNTVQSTKSSLSVFCSFYGKHYKVLPDELLKELEDVDSALHRKKSLQEQMITLTRFELFKDNNGIPLLSGYTQWEDWQLKKVNHAGIEFLARNRNKRTGAELVPGMLKAYIAGIQSAFSRKWGYDLNLFGGEVFGNKRTGVFAAFDNKIRQRQVAGVVRRSHNNLTTADIIKLYNSEYLSKSTPRGFMARILLDLVLITAFRRTEP
ncbi:hypothetical protein FGB62_106g07 [Gracilaria domingensis]|nr:hypothetical protein FGB62_106g07 [Gracilaria domingensis]